MKDEPLKGKIAEMLPTQKELRCSVAEMIQKRVAIRGKINGSTPFLGKCCVWQARNGV